jgi:PAS domain S-box-containing protein
MVKEIESKHILESIFEQINTENNDSQNLFQIIFTDNLTINLIIDIETNIIVNANKAACKFYGYSIDEIVGMKISQINLLSDDEIKQEIAKTTDNQLHSYSFEHKLKNGDIRFVDVYSCRIEINNRKLLYSTVIDVTNQKENEIYLNAAKNKADESDLFFRAICEQATEGISLADFKGNFTFVNPAYCNIVGYSEVELLKMNVEDLKPESETSVFKRTIEEDHTFFRNLKIKCKNSRIIYVDLSTKKIVTRDQHLVLGILRNVTEIVENESALIVALDKIRESEQQFKNIFNNLQDAYFEADINGSLTKMNAKAPKMFGYDSVDEMLGLPVNNLYANINVRLDLISKLSKQDSVVDFITQGKRKDGSIFWVSMNVQFKYDLEGHINGTVGVVRDITDRKIEEEKIKESEANYRNIYDNAIEGMYRTSLEGKNLQANKSLARILGYDSPEDVVNNITDSASQAWLNPTDRKKYAALLNKYGIIRNFECQLKRLDGEIIWVSLNAKLICNEKGEKLYYEGFLEDITDRKNKEFALIQAIEKADESERLKSFFLSNMSHEIRTPMSGILGFTGLINDSEDLADAKELALIARTSALRLMDTLTMIIDLAKLESGTTKIEYEEIDIVYILSEQFALKSELAKNKSLQIILDLKYKELFIYSSRVALETILSQLLSNAVKFSRNGYVKLYSEVLEDKYLIIKVEDTGIGIDEKNYELIFKEFRQVDEGLNRDHEGPGLGLTFVKKYCELIGASISIESEVKKGTTFIIQIPIIKENTIINRNNLNLINYQNDEIKNENFEIRILVVEDNVITNKLIAALLKEYIFVDFCRSKVEAEQKIEMNNYDIILMDITLGKGGSGIDITKKLRKSDKYKNIPIVAMTSISKDLNKEQLLDAGFTDFLGKPFVKDDLTAIIQKCCKVIKNT